MDKKERQLIATKKWQSKNMEHVKATKKLYRDKNKEAIKIYNKNYRLKNIKNLTIKTWKTYQGIIWNDYNIIYDLYINATNCDYCSKEFKNSLDKCCDHNHDITDANNIRGFLCRDCNFKDVLKGYDIMELC